MSQIPIVGRYINLDRSLDRRGQIEAEIAALADSAAYERFAGIDGRGVTTHPEVEERGALGCYLSHLEVIRRGAPAGAWLHVLEDDAVISRYFDAAAPVILADPQFAAFDVIFTNVMTRLRWEEAEAWGVLFDRNVITDAAGAVTAVNILSAVPLRDVVYGLTTSYLVNPRSIERVADLLAQRLEQPPFIPVDYAFHHLTHSGELSSACTVPFLTAPRLTAESTIREGEDPWRLGNLMMEWALFADRDPSDLTRRLDDLIQTRTPSVTSELIGKAHRYLRIAT